MWAQQRRNQHTLSASTPAESQLFATCRKSRDTRWHRSARLLSCGIHQHEATDRQHETKRHHIQEEHNSKPGKSISAIPMITGKELNPYAHTGRQHPAQHRKDKKR